MKSQKSNITNNAISDKRKEIDRIDDEILHLINSRADLALQIRKLKEEKSMHRFSPQRENEIITRLRQINKGPIYDQDVERIFNLIMKVMRELPNE